MHVRNWLIFHLRFSGQEDLLEDLVKRPAASECAVGVDEGIPVLGVALVEEGKVVLVPVVALLVGVVVVVAGVPTAAVEAVSLVVVHVQSVQGELCKTKIAYKKMLFRSKNGDFNASVFNGHTRPALSQFFVLKIRRLFSYDH